MHWFGYRMYIEMKAVRAATFALRRKKIWNDCLETCRTQLSFQAGTKLTDRGQETGLRFTGLSPGRICWPGKLPPPFPAAGNPWLNPTTWKALLGSVQWQTTDIAAAPCAFYLIAQIIYLVAHLNDLLLKLQNTRGQNERNTANWQLCPR